MGRTGLYELLIADEEIRHLAVQRTGAHEIKRAAVQRGMRTLRMDGWEKVLAGKTSVEEITRVTKAD